MFQSQGPMTEMANLRNGEVWEYGAKYDQPVNEGSVKKLIWAICKQYHRRGISVKSHSRAHNYLKWQSRLFTLSLP